jgi:putative ATP-dependent endonuclease of OLD family
VNVRGTSFYPFMYLFNSTDPNKKINKPITILTDDDRFTDSKEKIYSFHELIRNNYNRLNELDTNIQAGPPVVRHANLTSTANSATNISIQVAYKTLEYELCLANVNPDRRTIKDNFLFDYVNGILPDKIQAIIDYTSTFPSDTINDEQRRKIAILLWKALPSKAEFAQDFSIHLINNLATAKSTFSVPVYIKQGLNHLK